MDQSGALFDVLHQHRDWKESLAASDQTLSRPYNPSVKRRYIFFQGSFPIFNEAQALQKEVLEIVAGRVNEVSGSANSETLLAMYRDETYFIAAIGGINDQEKTRFADKLHASFESEPLEDGMLHQAEDIIKQELQSGKNPRILEWLREFSLDAAHPVFAASALRCLGRYPHVGTNVWRADLVRSALGMDDAEIREAAVQAAEFWGGEDIRDVLEAHNEPLPWLRDYVRAVVEDLGDEECLSRG